MNDAELIATTRSYVASIEKTSRFFDRRPPRDVPRFGQDECWVGKILGVGEFGVVSEVSNFVGVDDNGENDGYECASRNQEQETEPVDSETKAGTALLGSKEYMKQTIMRDGMARYAVKTLRKAFTNGDRGEDHLTTAVIDLALEARFLASLSHPNIVKIRGTIGTPGSRGFSLILDRLYLTLDEAIEYWKRGETKRFGSKLLSTKLGQKVFSMGTSKRASALSPAQCERLAALADVARALKYLHTNAIVYRDLKPQNVGQDVRGNFRIFDFGLAKELPSTEGQPAVAEDEYKMTSLVGTRRYMPPEVALCKTYGLSVDVYAFGLLLWEVCALRTPFGNISLSKHTANVILKGKRPPTPPVSWVGDELVALMKRCWAPDPPDRPTMPDICDSLRRQLERTGRKVWGRSIYLADQSMRSWRARRASIAKTLETSSCGEFR